MGESVTNVGRHAHATRAMVKIRVAEGLCTLTVRDNGVGIDESRPSGECRGWRGIGDLAGPTPPLGRPPTVNLDGALLSSVMRTVGR